MTSRFIRRFERIEGYSNAIRSAGYQPNVVVDLNTVDDIKKWVAKVYKTREMPAAVFSMNSVTSCRLLQALLEMGLSVPKDVAIVGFGDFDQAPILSPPLTVVAQSSVEMTKRAAMLLFDRITRTRSSTEFAPAKIVLPVTLIVRASCGCMSNSKNI